MFSGSNLINYSRFNCNKLSSKKLLRVQHPPLPFHSQCHCLVIAFSALFEIVFVCFAYFNPLCYVFFLPKIVILVLKPEYCAAPHPPPLSKPVHCLACNCFAHDKTLILYSKVSAFKVISPEK